MSILVHLSLRLQLNLKAGAEQTFLSWHMLFETQEQFIQVVKTFKNRRRIKTERRKAELVPDAGKTQNTTEKRFFMCIQLSDIRPRLSQNFLYHEKYTHPGITVTANSCQPALMLLKRDHDRTRAAKRQHHLFLRAIPK